jgi:hypothetical protein
MAVTENVRIVDRCPSCGHQTLFIGSGGWLTCSWLLCKAPGLKHALMDAREAMLRAKQLQHELDEARAEAAAMRVERDREIAGRVAVERGLSPETAQLLLGLKASPAVFDGVAALRPRESVAVGSPIELRHAYEIGFTDAKCGALEVLRLVSLMDSQR